MSARSSNSPALRLEIAESRVHSLLLLATCIASLGALYLLCERGYAVLAALLLPCAAATLFRCHRDALAGSWLIWREGHWSLRTGREEVPIELVPPSQALPWAIYLVWREIPAGGRRRAWLFSDCAPREGLRRLRVRLRLQF